MTPGAVTRGLRFVDTHAHLDELDDVASAVDEAAAAGVTRIIAMGTDATTSRATVDLSRRFPAVFAAVGHHPMNNIGPDLQELERLVADDRVVAVGEVGLDFAGHATTPPVEQERWLHAQCELAIANDLPVCVHVREAAAEVERVLSQHSSLKGVMHYFALDWTWAKRFLHLGFHLSFSGLITRPSRRELREVVAKCPADRLLLETDTPFGTPHTRSGQDNRPAWLLDTAALVAELREMTLEQLSEVEASNASHLFRRLN